MYRPFDDKSVLKSRFFCSPIKEVDINLGVIFKMYIICAECQKEKQICAIPKDLKPQCCEGLTCMAMNGTTNECVKLDGKHLYPSRDIPLYLHIF